MKRYLTLLPLLLFVFFSAANSQTVNGWFVTDSLDYALRNIKIIDSNNLVAIGDLNGATFLVKSEDGGNKWNVILDSVNSSRGSKNYISLSDMNVLGRNTLIAAGDSGVFIKEDKYPFKKFGIIKISNDAGASWRKEVLDSNTTVSSLQMIDSLKGIAVLTNRTNPNNTSVKKTFSIIYTNNGWKTFIKTNTYYEYYFSLGNIQAFKNGDIVFRLVLSSDKKEYIIRTDTSFAKSDTTFRGENLNISGMTFYDKNNGIVLMNKKNGNKTEYQILRTKDGGITFDVILNLPQDSLRLGWFIAPDIKSIYCTVMKPNTTNQYIIRSTNGGDSWTEEYIPFSAYLNNYSLTDMKMITPYQSIMSVVVNKPVRKCFILKSNGQLKLKAPVMNIAETKTSGKYKSDSLTIYWNKITGAKEYSINVSGMPIWDTKSYLGYVFGVYQFFGLPGREQKFTKVVTDTSLIIRNLNYSYYYEITINAQSDSIMSDYDDKTIETEFGILQESEVLKPITDSVVNPYKVNIVFKGIKGAEKYDVVLQKAGTSGFDYEDVFIQRDLLDTLLTIKQLPPNSEFRFLIRAIKEREVGPWGGNDNYFRTNDEPDAIAEEHRIYSDTKIFPQPVINSANLVLTSEKPEKCTIQVIDIFGRIAPLWQGILSEGKNDIRLDMSGFAPGCYSLIIEGERGKRFMKLIKE